MTVEDKNHACAELLGFVDDGTNGWEDEKGDYVCDIEPDFYSEFWNPYQNLTQAVKYLVPWLNEQGYDVEFEADKEGYVDCVVTDRKPTDRSAHVIKGTGTTPDEKMASALAECCLKVGAKREAT